MCNGASQNPICAQLRSTVAFNILNEGMMAGKLEQMKPTAVRKWTWRLRTVEVQQGAE